MPIRHVVNANICMVSSFGCHHSREEAITRSLQGFEFFGFALGNLYGFGAHRPGRSNLWEEFQETWAQHKAEIELVSSIALSGARGGTGTPNDLRRHLRSFEESGVYQVTFIQQAGGNRHEHICEALELFTAEVMTEFKEQEEAREERKRDELAPYLEAAPARKARMQVPRDEEIPVFPALGRRISEEDSAGASIYGHRGGV